MITYLISCNVTPLDVIRADLCRLLLIISVVKVQSIMSIHTNKIYESHGEYIPDSDELCDSRTAIFEKNVSECFDSLYIKYGNERLSRIVYLKEKVNIEIKKHYTNIM